MDGFYNSGSLLQLLKLKNKQNFWGFQNLKNNDFDFRKFFVLFL